MNLHFLLSQARVSARPSVLWCYKKELGFTRSDLFQLLGLGSSTNCPSVYLFCADYAVIGRNEKLKSREMSNEESGRQMSKILLKYSLPLRIFGIRPYFYSFLLLFVLTERDGITN